ncbi:hypothetical protein F2Q69_00031616 [Brassica cretica]|uniref:Uncharacterized protein n=1 Tax=Brassica cretica TaxID=69181 RepID=A0A8S9RWD4_BRACR|nr:hypothetical protein F2Q69_00031616 [Brassica cretica]
MFKCRCTRFGKYTISTLASKLEKITFSGNITQNILLPFPPSIPDTFIALTRLHWPQRFILLRLEALPQDRIHTRDAQHPPVNLMITQVFES